MDYILEADRKCGCIFCFNDEVCRPEQLVLFLDADIGIMMNKYPYNNGHLLIAPRRHTNRLEELTNGEQLAMMRGLNQSLAALEAEMKPQGFNIGINLGRVAGAGVADHLHWHVVPRWNGDTNFMPVTADVKVMPEHIRATYAKLKVHF